LYFLDTQDLQKCGPLQCPHLIQELLNLLLTKLREDNLITRDYPVLRKVVDNVAEENFPQVRMVSKSAPTTDTREHPSRYKLPHGTEVAALIIGGNDI
jgi:hypothetical protein